MPAAGRKNCQNRQLLNDSTSRRGSRKNRIIIFALTAARYISAAARTAESMGRSFLTKVQKSERSLGRSPIHPAVAPKTDKTVDTADIAAHGIRMDVCGYTRLVRMAASGKALEEKSRA